VTRGAEGPAERRPAAVVIFAKAPVPGRVKTRLAADLGAEAAAALQEALILDTADVVVEAALALGLASPFCAAAEPEDEPVLASMLPAAFRVVPQGSGDLGARLARVLGRLTEGRAGAVALGADCPDLAPRHVAAAVAALRNGDAVLGPAEDGGCWSIGVARPLRAAFAHVPWSTSGVHEALRERLGAAGASVVELERLRDVDRRDDLLRWSSRPGPGFPRTRAWWRSVRSRQGRWGDAGGEAAGGPPGGADGSPARGAAGGAPRGAAGDRESTDPRPPQTEEASRGAAP
jgi:rSAM/selenodomain-associated transferase 1